MLPHAYELPAAIVLVLGGALSCFAGYRMFRLVLGIYGFVIGAAIATSTMAPPSAAGVLVTAIVGGLVGAVVLVLLYFIFIAIVGAGLGAYVMSVVWQRFGVGDPPWVAVIVLAVLGAIGAMFLQRYVIIVSTAFVGSWTIIVGGLALAGDRSAVRAAQATVAGNASIFYPFAPAPGQTWVPLAWILLGLIGTAVQLGVTGKKR